MTDADLMRRALFHASRSEGATTPNPLVGAVIVSPDGVIVGQGRHPRAGEPHAEVFAIEDAGASLAGLSTNVQPVAITAPIFRRGRSTGSFHGVMSPHTPTGSLRMKLRRWLGAEAVTSPRIILAALA